MEVLIRGLPSWSLTVEARANDEEVAEQMLERLKGAGGGGTQPPRLSEYGPAVARLDGIAERIEAQTATILSIVGEKPRRPRPAPRPVTAAQRVQSRVRDARVAGLFEEVAAAQERWAAAHE